MGRLSGVLFFLIFGSLSADAAQQTTSAEKAKYGSNFGNINTIKYEVKGNVYAMNQHKLFIRGFSYNGDGIDPVFQIKNKGPSTALIEIPYPADSRDHLNKTDNNDIVLKLPAGQTVSKIDTLYVRARTNSGNEDESVYGRLTFDSGISIPKEEELDKFTEREHGLKSDKVIIKDAKTLFIPNFHYDGTAPTAYFYVGSGQGVEARKNPKTKVNFLKEGNQRLTEKYNGENVTITLPGDLNVYDIGWLSVWCDKFSQEFGHVDIPNAETFIVPPYMGMKEESVSPPQDTPREEKNDTTNGATFLLTNFILFATTISTIAFIY